MEDNIDIGDLLIIANSSNFDVHWNVGWDNVTISKEQVDKLIWELAKARAKQESFRRVEEWFTTIKY